MRLKLAEELCSEFNTYPCLRLSFNCLRFNPICRAFNRYRCDINIISVVHRRNILFILLLMYDPFLET